MSRAACSGFFPTTPDDRLSIRWLRLVRGLAAIAFCLAAASAWAQVPDSVAATDHAVDSTGVILAPPDSSFADSTLTGPVVVDSTAVDSTVAPPAPRVVGPPIEVDIYREGIFTDSVPIVRVFSADPVELLDRMPGSFRYSMGNLGWPDQVSFLGLSPSATGLTLDGIPLHDPVTGRALFDVLPVDLLNAPGIFAGRHASVAGAAFSTRRFDVEQPHTELRYRVGGPEYQSISATHVQQLRIGLLGTPTLLQVLFRYASSGWDGDYPNSVSDLTQMDARVGLYTENWALRVSNFLTRRHGGAHGGVVVRGGDFDTIYTRFNASVEQPNATFRTKRNDLRVAFDRALSANLKPLSLQFSWASYVRRYRNVVTPEALVHEYAIAAVQELPRLVDGQELIVRLISRFDDVRSASVFADTSDLGRSSLEALLESRTDLGGITFDGDAGLSQSDGHSFPQLRAGIKTSRLGLAIASDLSMSGRMPSRLETAGSAHIGVPLGSDLDPEKFLTAALTVERSFGTSRLLLEGSVASRSRPIEVRMIAADTFAVVQSSDAITRYAFTGSLGWRVRAERGLRADLQATVGSTSGTGTDAFLEAVSESVPSLDARFLFGTRYVLFEGDLDLNLYVLGRYWSSFKSRVYDPITGVLALGGADARTIGNSGTLDVRVEAGIRSATLYVGFENALAGASYPGVSLVAPYPLPAQAFRFGVFWPIDN